MSKMSDQRSGWHERLHASPSRMEQELAFKLQEDGIHYQTQVEIPVTTADFYFPLDTRPLLVFVDGRVHLGKSNIAALPYVRVCVEESRARRACSHATFPSIGIFSRQVASRFPKPSLPIRRKTHPSTGHSRMKILRGIR